MHWIVIFFLFLALSHISSQSSDSVRSSEYFPLHPTGFSTEIEEISRKHKLSDDLWRSVEEMYGDSYEEKKLPVLKDLRDDLRILGVTSFRRYFISSQRVHI